MQVPAGLPITKPISAPALSQTRASGISCEHITIETTQQN